MRTENGVLLLHARLAHARNQSQPLISLFEVNVLSALLEQPDMTIADMMKELALSARSIHRILTELRAKGYIVRNGARKNSSWIVIKDAQS